MRGKTVLRTRKKNVYRKKKRQPQRQPSSATFTQVARRIQLFSDSSGPDWLKTLMEWTHIAISIYGFLVGSDGAAPPTEKKIVPLGGIVGIDLGPDDLIAESPYVSGFPPDQVTAWNLAGVDYCLYSQMKIHSVRIKIVPQQSLAHRGGTIITALEPLPMDASEYEGVSTKKAGERVDSITSLLSLPSARSSTFDREIVRTIRGPRTWQAVGVPGTAVEGAKPAAAGVDWKWPLNKYSSAKSVCGGRPIFRFWLAYESINHIDTKTTMALNHLSVDLEITAKIELRAPTGQPQIETVDKQVIMNVSTGSIVRRMPITVEAGRILQLGVNRRLSYDKDNKVATALDVELAGLTLGSSEYGMI